MILTTFKSYVLNDLYNFISSANFSSSLSLLFTAIKYLFVLFIRLLTLY